MALDKQKILSELGSVMNQLKSADCGCIGKLFGNTNPHPSSPMQVPSGCKHGCCHSHGHNNCTPYTPCMGAPCPSTNSRHMNQSCMGHCNPAKMYGDTYHYLSENLMQPVVNEVYNDLKTITPANTIMNNEGVNATTASQGQTNMQPQGQTNMQLMQNKDSAKLENTPNTNQSPRMEGQVNGMGPHLVNMMMSGNKMKANDIQGDTGSLTQPVVIDAPQSPHGKVGIMPLPVQTNMHQGGDRQIHTFNQHRENNQGNLGNQVQGANQNKLLSIPNVNANYGVQNMTPNPKHFGQHTQGIAKFNEMFPGVTQNLGGDLGFDPMAIAVQMNPANQKRAAMHTMHRIMNNNNSEVNNNFNPTQTEQQPVVGTGSEATHMLATNLEHSNINPNQVQQSNFAMPLNDQMSTNEQIMQNKDQLNYSYNEGIKSYPQAYATLTSASGGYQQPGQQQQQFQGLPQQYMQQQQIRTNMADPNANNLISNNKEMVNTPMIQMQQSTLNSPPIPEFVPMPNTPQQIVKEPTFPASTTQNQLISHLKQPVSYTYNTLGQPIEMLPAEIYHSKDPGGPQTLSPQDIPSKPKDPKIFSNVKSTVSKTSIIGNRPIGKISSRSQLQNIYNQYKGSQSLTHHNISGYNERASYSEDQFKIPHQRTEGVAPNHQIVEKIGGDSLLDTESNQNSQRKTEQVPGHIGDVPHSNEIQSNGMTEPTLTRKPKARNGLQDMVYTSYPSSAAWSFHGHTRPPLSVGARVKTRF
ncbi:unnamed protein product [Parnassius mnemosyne]|uniref:Uncharacterized protein n=1 Tax=Parnassius mnemosyne TaxID=213953 RepID=A0AAV1KW60_9NEOP